MKNFTQTLIGSVLATAGLLAATSAMAGKTLDQIKQRGQIVCGVNTGLAGFSAADSSGNWSGLDVDHCRAVAAAVLSYYDGQGFMVPKGKITSAKQLKGATVCVQSGTTTEKNLTDFSRANKLNLKPVVFEKVEAATGAYFAGRCQAYTTDASGLASVRAKEAKDPAAHVILPDLISKEPLGPMVRRGDDEWFAINKWVQAGLIEAEEYGITQANVDQMKTSENPQIGRLLGATEDLGKHLGLDKEWLYRAIKTTGNYGEMFERNVGPKTAINLPRGLNNQWNKGGLMYAAPLR